MVFIFWLGLSLNTAHADEVTATVGVSYRYDDSDTWHNIPGTNLTFNHTYQLRFSIIPDYSFVTNHFYNVKMTFNHSNGNYSFDSASYHQANWWSSPINDNTVSYEYKNVTSSEGSLIVNGLSGTNINRLLQNLRFFFFATPLDNGTTTSGSIHVNMVKLYIEDVTASFVLPDINNKLDDTNSKLDGVNSKLDDSNQKQQTIIDKITNLPNTLRDMLLGFFVPTDEEFDSFIEDFNDLIYLRLGCVAQTLDFFGDIIDTFIHATAANQIYIPRLEVWVPINSGQVVTEHTLTLWNGGYINVMPTEWSFAASNINYIRTIIDIICLFMLFRYLINVFYSIVSPEITESMTLHEILEELEFRTLD